MTNIPVTAMASEDKAVSTSHEDFYSNRVQYLDRLRQQFFTCKFHSTGDLRPIGTGSSDFAKLGTDMISLLENDVQLTKQLIDLSSAIEQLKTYFASRNNSVRRLPKVLSNSSLDEVDQFDEYHEVAHIRIDDEEIEHIQYFQRQNSALRIPIKPRGRLRTEDLTVNASQCSRKKVEQRKSFPMYEAAISSNGSLHSPNSDSGLSSSGADGRSTVAVVVNTSTNVLVCHGSQSSFDSGVHSASPEEREEIFV